MNSLSLFTLLALLSMHVAYATNNNCSPVCPKPCPPKKECLPPCPPKPCKPCPPVCFERGYPTDPCCTPSAYNEPAGYELGPCPWDFWVDASFAYWLAYEEGLDLGVSSATVEGFQPFVGSVYLFQDTSFKPGFKVGIGMDIGHDYWSAFAEYTWFRSRTTTSASAPAGPAGSTNPAWNIRNWDLGQTITEATPISSVWRLRMDLLDAALTRPFYQGTHLIVAPFGGMRAAWIRQNLRMEVFPFTTSEGQATSFAVFHNRSSSWAIGPRAGLQGEWHVGCGFRFEGDIAGSLLFTRYTTVAAAADSTTAILPVQWSARYTDYDTLILLDSTVI